jgi:hypothetical protein
MDITPAIDSGNVPMNIQLVNFIVQMAQALSDEER